MASVSKLTNENYASLLQQSNQYPILVLFTLQGCPHCNKGLAIARAFAKQWEGGRVGSAREDTVPEIRKQLRLKTFPAYVLFVGGRAVRKTEGLTEGEELTRFVQP